MPVATVAFDGLGDVDEAPPPPTDTALASDLDAQGWAVLPGLLTPAECVTTATLYDAGEGFRSHVVMARHGYGRGEYRYFSYPLPPLVARLRTDLYLRIVANAWHGA